MATVMVTVGTDGNTDWVKLPNGEKLTLGAVSVARFLGALTRQPLRKSLDSFLLYGETTASVDLDQMFDLLKPIRVRLADGSFIPSLGQTSTRNPMNELLAIEASISQAEKILGVLARKAASGQTNGIETVRQDFIKAANKIQSPNQSKNQKLAYDVLQENSTVAGEILACLQGQARPAWGFHQGGGYPSGCGLHPVVGSGGPEQACLSGQCNPRDLLLEGQAGRLNPVLADQKLTMDHVIPLSKGGTHVVDNVDLATLGRTIA
jgi:5-methylcytosine-specific restriction endonuclease McrA